MPDSQQTDQLFFALLDDLQDQIGVRHAVIMREDYDAGEPVVAFENLVDGIVESDISLNASQKQDVLLIATALGCLEYPGGKGELWQ